MKTQKTDRRSQRTQRLVGNALISLMREKRYDHITVQDILDRADIGRATFYEHYFDKDDLLASELERVVDLLDQHNAPSGQNGTVFLPGRGFFEHVYEQYPLYQALLRGKGLDSATQALQNHLRTQVKHGLREIKGVPDDLVTPVAAFIVGTFITLLQWWLETELAWSPERMDALFRDLVLPGVQRLLFQDDQAGENMSSSHIK
ncbi:MAG: TetR/AcrR family transcriptional regulator [Chloroflexota bacterium]|nr:TetR/AcrR family transcriptional regulator [Chloroflexota bacterium]